MTKLKKEQNFQQLYKTYCPNNFPLWQFCDKILLHKPTQTIIKEFT